MMKTFLLPHIAASALLVSLAGCSSKLSEADVYLAMAKVEQAVQQQDCAAIAHWLAPQAEVVIDMRQADSPEPLRLNKSEYLQLLGASWIAAGSRYSHERSNTRVEMAPGGVCTDNAALQLQATPCPPPIPSLARTPHRPWSKGSTTWC